MNKSQALSAHNRPHRVPPYGMGIIPNNTGSLSDTKRTRLIFVHIELISLQVRRRDDQHQTIQFRIQKSSEFPLPTLASIEAD